MEGGKQQSIHYCGRKPIKNYIAKTGKAAVGIDIGNNAKILIRYTMEFMAWTIVCISHFI